MSENMFYKKRDNKAHKGFPAAANNRVKVLSPMFAWVIKRQLYPDWFVNPAREIDKLQEDLFIMPVSIRSKGGLNNTGL